MRQMFKLNNIEQGQQQQFPKDHNGFKRVLGLKFTKNRLFLYSFSSNAIFLTLRLIIRNVILHQTTLLLLGHEQKQHTGATLNESFV